MPLALPGRSKGALLEKWSSRTLSTCGFSCFQSAPDAAVTETKSRPKKTPSTSPVEKIASASGDGSASSGGAKSRRPAAFLRGGEVARPRLHHPLAGKEFESRRIGRGFGLDQHSVNVGPRAPGIK